MLIAMRFDSAAAGGIEVATALVRQYIRGRVWGMSCDRFWTNSAGRAWRNQLTRTLLAASLIASFAILLVAPGASARPFRYVTHPQGLVDYWPRWSPDGKQSCSAAAMRPPDVPAERLPVSGNSLPYLRAAGIPRS